MNVFNIHKVKSEKSTLRSMLIAIASRATDTFQLMRGKTYLIWRVTPSLYAVSIDTSPGCFECGVSYTVM